MPTENSLLNVKPTIPAPLDPGFTPAVLVNRAYCAAAAAAAGGEMLGVALERDKGLVTRKDLPLLPAGAAHDADTLRVAERHIKFMLWARGGWKLMLAGPPAVCEAIRTAYAPGGARAFDAEMMERAYDRPFEVHVVAPEDLPEAAEGSATIGGHLDGCRIGFDLGASDYKLAAVVDGEPVFSTEIPWDPKNQSDPAYHYGHIMDGLKQAAGQMPRIHAIGGSSAGLIVDNQVKVASLFRGIPADQFDTGAKPIFLKVQKEFGVPLEVANDGDVTALAGAMSLEKHAMLGIAMGSSEAAGFLTREGCITGWLNELAFAPVDFNPDAPPDEWSGDRGVGALYFSQQAVNKLAPAAGFSFPDDMDLPIRLKEVQKKADAEDAEALRIFETIGVYLGYSLAHYADYYDYENLLILGRVTSGRGGETLLAAAKDVLASQFPERYEKITLHVPDEKSRRVGQAVAAASLPEIQ